jgi:hypothetical protein
MIGLDIGGANLKAWHSSRLAIHESFALWKSPELLSSRLRGLLDSMPPAERVLVTMTGELADCYTTKREGVTAICQAVVEASGSWSPVAQVEFWQTTGGFVDQARAVAEPLLTAASNWHALASMTGVLFPHDDLLLVDIGSTTTDLIPVNRGRVAAVGRTDLTRLAAGELVYTGVRRTSLCAVLPVFEGELAAWGRVSIPVSSELFATSQDVHLLLGHLEEDASFCETADGRPATKAFAAARIARQWCSDDLELTPADVRSLAQAAAASQRSQITQAAGRVLIREGGSSRKLVLAGEGEFVGREVARELGFAEEKIISLKQHWTAAGSEAACARALVELARHQGAAIFQR